MGSNVPNCLFCMEPVGADDLTLAILPCMCRLDHHDSCRAQWNRMNPYKCPLCRKKFEIERRPMVETYNALGGGGGVYIPIPSAPAPVQTQVQTQVQARTLTQAQARTRLRCTPALAVVSILGIMLMILLIIYIKFLSS